MMAVAASVFRKVGAKVAQLHRRIDDCWIGDVIGIASIFAGTFYLLHVTGPF